MRTTANLSSVPLLFGEMDLVKSINITRLTELYTSDFIFRGIGKTIIIEILYWIMVEPEFLIWMM